eukprot:TRINITY_DN43388_c0_g1_i1.p1 TRINITY_DN43388_c0_g1~~TRINITY_DN43388_c0_g1_i1.p1  ORF type:complete len:301 (+),score=88.83 TRINITY_DN43388_c0_g1_i1:102-1004(+)
MTAATASMDDIARIREEASLKLKRIVQFKDDGNTKLKADDKEGALESYSQGLQEGHRLITDFQGLAEDLEPLKKAFTQLCSNRAHVFLLLDRPADALKDCKRAVEVDFENSKAYWRGATAALKLEDEDAAAELLRQGLRMAWQSPGASALAELLGKSLDAWQRGAAKGSAAAQYMLALCHLKGNGVPQDNNKALEHFQKAAARGDEMSQEMATQLQAQKEQAEAKARSSVPEHALEIWARAAADGDASAQFNLGLAYLKGEGVPKDHSKCIELWTKAAEQGDEMAQRNLAAVMADQQRGS